MTASWGGWIPAAQAFAVPAVAYDREFVQLRVPKLFNLRTDPFERADVTSNTYYDWMVDNVYLILAATAAVTQFLDTFKEFPPAQHAASFTIDQAVAKLQTALATGR
jgi:hypothetical protein